MGFGQALGYGFRTTRSAKAGTLASCVNYFGRENASRDLDRPILCHRNTSAPREEKTFSLLVVRDGETSTYPLAATGKVLIGRAREADVRIDHGSVSRDHAVLHLGPTLRIEILAAPTERAFVTLRSSRTSQMQSSRSDVVNLGAVLLVV